jgi:hypothetical protein
VDQVVQLDVGGTSLATSTVGVLRMAAMLAEARRFFNKAIENP